MIKNTLPDKSGNLESLKKKKKNRNSLKVFQPMCPWLARIFWERLQVVLFTILWFKWSVKKHCLGQVLLATWEIFLHEKSRDSNSYRFSHKFFFYLLFIFSYKPITRIGVSASWWSGNEKYFCFLFIASRALLQSHAEFNRLYKIIFLDVIPVRIIVSWLD